MYDVYRMFRPLALILIASFSMALTTPLGLCEGDPEWDLPRHLSEDEKVVLPEGSLFELRTNRYLRDGTLVRGYPGHEGGVVEGFEVNLPFAAYVTSSKTNNLVWRDAGKSEAIMVAGCLFHRSCT